MYQHLLLAGLAALLPLSTIQAQAISFGPATAYSTAPSGTWSTNWAALADVNADSRPDAVVMALNYITYASQVAVLLGTATGTLQAPTYYPVGQGSKFLVVADVNADNRPDVVTADQFSAQVSVLLNGGSNTFQPAVAYPTGANTSPSELAVADMNADGQPDPVVAAVGGGIVVLRGNGKGTFQAPVSYSAGPNSNAMRLAVADFNADGRPDVATPGNANNVLVLLNTSTGALQAPVSYPAGTSAYAIAVADLNTDGRPDLLTSSSAGVGVLLGSASPAFQPPVVYPLAGVISVNDAVAADLNGDGRPDVLTANFATTATASVLPGTGTGTLQAATTFTVGPASSQPNRVAAADINGDGRPDLLTANRDNNTLSVLLSTTPLAARPTLPSAQVQLCPNPADATGTSLALTGLPAEVQQVQATLHDVTGRVVAQAELPAWQGVARAQLPTTGLAPGLYLVHLTARGRPGAATGVLPAQHLLVP
ncbi:hypothetical protein GO988_14590 [Hymenobacter sp. HMF4947]|uniref:T9SS type A sorting domain-containing protein n=1 Tax=Hymenobacter ginkgonis TaxID=2682976 RepID=A0A7K1TGM8_9BACT|nr:VCBS repeat-containing protein [Hymenobacter ginkgonis]MVN77560.1 hypothetical protein [Hymenobacter ginkgonis]